MTTNINAHEDYYIHVPKRIFKGIFGSVFGTYFIICLSYFLSVTDTVIVPCWAGVGVILLIISLLCAMAYNFIFNILE